tara:strand:- start:226 stop:501 length:276 start_codon:yes stop_codon:yes gene_type:complete
MISIAKIDTLTIYADIAYRFEDKIIIQIYSYTNDEEKKNVHAFVETISECKFKIISYDSQSNELKEKFKTIKTFDGEDRLAIYRHAFKFYY